MRILLTIEYNGKDFAGWQSQPNKRTVQGVLEDALSSVCGEKIVLNASGRTDAGVHALKQMAHFDTSSSLPYNKYPQIVNHLLDNDVSIINSQLVDDDFHARFNVKKKSYLYKCYQSKVARPLMENFAYQLTYDVDVEKMRRAAAKLVGEHDFTSFKKASDIKLDCVRTIYDISINQKDDILEFIVCGSGFMHNMVRIIVGTLIDIGKGLLEESEIDVMLEKKNRSCAGTTLPACGLYLYNVEY